MSGVSGQSQRADCRERYDHRRADAGGVIAKRGWRVLKRTTWGSAGEHVGVLALALLCLLAGCAAPTGLTPGASPVAAVPASAVEPTTDTRPENAVAAPSSGLPRFAPSPAASPVPAEPLVARAVADAAERAGTVPAAVAVVEVEAREWPDRSLGCPQPGMGYAQSITPGYLIVVEVHGRRMRYHTDHAQVVYCDAPL